jgi:hypothetical protein
LDIPELFQVLRRAPAHVPTDPDDLVVFAIASNASIIAPHEMFGPATTPPTFMTGAGLASDPAAQWKTMETGITLNRIACNDRRSNLIALHRDENPMKMISIGAPPSRSSVKSG